MEACQTFELGDDIEVRIYPDSDAESSREWDCFGRMVCWHSRFNLGDVQTSKSPEEYLEKLAIEADPEIAEIKERVLAIEDHFYRYGQPTSKAETIAADYLKNRIENTLCRNYVMLPLYLYDHSGLVMRTSAFACPWDSGQVGFIYVRKEDVIKEFGKWTFLTIEKAEQLLNSEVETYSQFLEGDVYGYEVIQTNKDGTEKHLDSCWGFYGLDHCKDEAMLVAGKYEHTSNS